MRLRRKKTRSAGLANPNRSRGGGATLAVPSAEERALPATAAERDALLAAGFKIKRRDGDTLRRLIMPWQPRAFAYYDLLGEVKYAAQFYARLLGPLRLYVEELDEASGDWEESKDAAAIEALDRITDPGGTGRSGLLEAYGRLMFLNGECYLFVSSDPDTGQEQWEMLSTDELRPIGSSYIRYKAPSLAAEEYHEPPDDEYTLPEQQDGDWSPIDRQAIAYRLWQRHPRFSMYADCTMQGVLDICEELVLLTQAIRSRARSRLAGSGILFLSDDFSMTPLEPTPDEDPEEDPFLADLTDAMMKPIGDEGAASAVVPLVVRGPSEAIEKGVKHLQIIDPTQVYPETGLRYELIKRLAIGLDMPPEQLLGMTDANHWCVDEETEILTSAGWRRHDEIEVGDEVLTLDHESGRSTWQPIQDVARFEVEDLPMLSFESRYHSSLTTMNHRWPVLRLAGRAARWARAWTHSDELRTTHRLVTAAASSDVPGEATYPDALVELVAWLWTEGSVSVRPGRRHPRVTIYQSERANPDNVLRIRAALTALHGAGVLAPMPSSRRGPLDPQPRWRETSADGVAAFSLNVTAAAPLLEHVDHERVVSLDFVRSLTRAQLDLFIDVSVLADGHVMSGGTPIVSQGERARLEPLELAAILSGRSPVSGVQEVDGFTRHIQHTLTISDRQTVRVKRSHLSTRSYTGTIWCPVTPTRTWLAKRAGRVFFTGNTGWMIDEQTWKNHGLPKAIQLCNDLNQAYYSPYLRDELEREDWARFRIGYDPSTVINHPDRTKDAKDLYDRNIVGKSFVREACGIDEDAAPTTEEEAERIGILVRDASLAWYGIPSVRSGGIEPQPGEIENAAGSSSEPGVSTGAEVEPGPPAKGAEDQQAEEITAAATNGQAARIAGAADLALHRAREAAGNRLRSLAKRDPEALALVEGVRAGQVAAKLGRARVRQLRAPAESELVAGARDLVLDALRLWDVNPDVAELVASLVEAHATRTLYEETPAPIPDAWTARIAGALAATRRDR